MAVNKFVKGSEVVFDLTADTVDRTKVLSGATFHLPSGEKTTGTCAFDVDSSGATAQVAEVLNTKTFAARGAIMTGTMPNIGKQTGTISTKNGSVTISQGYHDGSGTVTLDPVEVSKLQPANIAENVVLFGVTGSHKSGTAEVKQAKSVAPTFEEQVVTPDAGFTCLSQVTVGAIGWTEVPNAAGGITVTIG